MAIVSETVGSLALYPRIRDALGMPQIQSDDDILKAVENRMPVTVVGALIAAGLTQEEVHSLIVPQRTLSHRKARNEPLSADESDRAARVARVVALAERVFADHEKAMRWLRKPKRRFDGRTPMEMLTTEAGGRLVEEMLYQADYGMAA